MLTIFLKKLLKAQNLSAVECEQALNTMLTLNNPEQIAAFLVLMRAKGETADEITAFVQAMRAHQVSVDVDIPLCDIVGTGGDGGNTANISTTASIMAASCGVAILKHGNRAVSSQSGAADVLEALGLKLENDPKTVASAVVQKRFGFCYAPLFHPAMLALKPIRTRLKMPTLFNLMGPLLNPGKAQHMVLGVADRDIMPLIADVLIQLGVKRAMVVHGNGLDELNCLGICDVIEIEGVRMKSYPLDPLDFGFSLCTLKDLMGGDPYDNASLLKQVINGEASHLANTVILNAAAAVYIHGQTDTLSAAVILVKEQIINGSVKRTFNQIMNSYSEVSHE